MALLTCHLPMSPLAIEDLVVLSGAMRNIIVKSFGPGGQQTLIATSVGNVAVKRDGLAVLSTVHFAHPVARYILDSLYSFEKIYGDGNKCCVIYLYELFKAIEKESYNEGTETVKHFSAKLLYEFLTNEFLSILDHVQQIVLSQNICRMKEPGFLKESVRSIVQSCLGGSWSTPHTPHISEVVASYLLYDDGGEQFHLGMACRWFENCVYTVAGNSSAYSHLMEGVCVNGYIVTSEASHLSSLKTICMQCPLEGAESTSQADVLQVFTVGVKESLINHRFKAAQIFLSMLKEDDVSLIWIAKKVPDYILQLCKTLGIGIGVLADESDIDFLIFLSGCTPVTNIHECITSKHTMYVNSCANIKIGAQSCVKVLLLNAKNPQCLILHGPTRDMCLQLKAAVKKSVKVIENCVLDCEGKHRSPSGDLEGLLLGEEREILSNRCAKNVMAGGGFFEYLLIHLLQQYEEGDIATAKKLCCRVVKQMLQGVPRSLHDNLSSDAPTKSLYIALHKKLLESMARDSVSGFGSQGQVCDPSQSGFLDVLSIKSAAIFTVVNLAASLLKIDAIIGVTRKEHGPACLDTDDDDIG